MSRIINRLRRPTADNTANSYLNQVIGNKADAAAAGAVTSTDTLVAYIKQLVGYGVSEADVEGKIDIIDAVLGALDDAAAAGAVTDADTVMAYAKQLVTAAIANAAQVLKVDGVTLATAPVAKSLAAYIASGGTALGQELPDSMSLVDIIGDYTGAHDGAAADDNIKAAIDLEAAKTLKIDGATLATAPVANSLARYVASGGTALGQQLPDSMSLVDIIGDFTGAHDGAAQDDNIKASMDLAHTDLDAIIQQVARTTAKKNVASLTTANLFTVAGGAVRVLGLAGYLVAACEAAANNTKIVHTPTGGAAADLCAVLDVTGSAIRKLLTITGTKANAMALSADEGVIVDNMATAVVLMPGVLSLNCANTTTGDIDWYVLYEPLAPGATITAA